MSKPLAIDLFCGLGGWTKGFLDEGYEVIGFDIERKASYPGEFILQDVATICGYDLRAVSPTVIVASPPCQAYSYRAMPWKRAKALPPPSNELFDACFRIAREAGCLLIVENVKGAQPWVGRAKWHYGSFYLWGDVPALMPSTLRVLKHNPDGTNHGSGSWFKIADSKNRGARSEGMKVPGFNFHQHEKTGKPGGSFQQAAVDGLKTVGHANIRDGHSNTRHLTNRRELDAIKQHGSGPEWLDIGIANMSSGSLSRKAASAAIAEIPYDLANWIARCFKPETAVAVRPQPFSQSPAESVPSR